ncbi:hypothetical protein MMC28_005094 [Mycoblastus sanguinarius]|nr:hypothetical protein [Mycoblastus sanguinarius]
MFDPSNSPVIPERISARTSLSPKSKEERRRRSLPATSKRDGSRRSSNRVIVKPASTEVISSLIETLSAISSPAEHHFDSFPNIASSNSTPASPCPWQTESPLITNSSCNTHQSSPMSSSLLGFALDDSIQARPHGVHSNYFLHPGHPSGASVRGSSPRRASSDRSLRQKTKKPKDLYNLDGEFSIGNLSIEPWQSTTSVNSTGSDARKGIKSARSFNSIRFTGSKDSLRESSLLKAFKPNAKLERDHTRGRLFLGDTPPEPPASDRLVISKRAARNSVLSEPPDVPSRASSTRSAISLRRLYRNTNDVASGPRYNIPNQDNIPSRNSSMRHSSALLPSYRQRSTQRSEKSDATPENRTSSIENQSMMSQQDLEKSDEPAEDVVSRRIKELKDQKLQRERNSMETSSELLSAPRTPDRSLSPSPSPVVQQAVKIITAIEEVSVVEAEEFKREAENEKSAPSPAIAQRIDRSVAILPSSMGNKSPVVKHPHSDSKEETRRTSTSLPPQRSNSRLLKRLSQSTSPATAQKHRRTFSNPLNQQSRSTSYRTESGDSIGDAVEEYLLSPKLSQRITHPQTGRVISFSEVGDPKGSAVFCCVGMGLTRFVTAFYDELASTLKLRLVTPDRPGVGGSETHADGLDTPLGWPDDILAICQHLRITKFSIIAHSAGAVYALATALRIPQHIRCRVHLLAPWIPPSQMSTMGAQQEALPASALPFSQRFLRSLPTTFLRAANSGFLSATSDSITTSLPKSPRRFGRRSSSRAATPAPDLHGATNNGRRDSSSSPKMRSSGIDQDFLKENRPPNADSSDPVNGKSTSQTVTEKERRSSYEARLTGAIWEAATTGANPAVDLLVCLERRQPIGFRYVDIKRAVVIHHGSKDTRVPVENVRWLGKTMRRCEVRVLEGEGHGLMASAVVMSNVLMEIAQEWDDWNRVVKGKAGMDRGLTNGA